MPKLLHCFAVIMFLCVSCKQREAITEYFVSLNTFNIQPNALQPGDSLRLIYASRANDRNDSFGYLIQVVAIKLSTQDTVNILCTHTDQIEQTDGNKVFRFVPMDSVKQGLISRSDSLNKTFFTNDSFEGVTTEVYGELKWGMVVRDPKYKEFDNKNYPTVIGEIEE